MTPLVQRYRELISEADAAGNEVVRDRRLDEADEVWWAMSSAERDEVDPAGALGRSIARGNL